MAQVIGGALDALGLVDYGNAVPAPRSERAESSRTQRDNIPLTETTNPPAGFGVRTMRLPDRTRSRLCQCGSPSPMAKTLWRAAPRIGRSPAPNIRAVSERVRRGQRCTKLGRRRRGHPFPRVRETPEQVPVAFVARTTSESANATLDVVATVTPSSGTDGPSSRPQRFRRPTWGVSPTARKALPEQAHDLPHSVRRAPAGRGDIRARHENSRRNSAEATAESLDRVGQVRSPSVLWPIRLDLAPCPGTASAHRLRAPAPGSKRTPVKTTRGVRPDRHEAFPTPLARQEGRGGTSA